MKKSLSEMIKTLEAAGIDTSKFSVTIDGKDLKSFEEILSDKTNEIVGSEQVENKTFRRWVLAQTMRMLYTPVWDAEKGQYVKGWESYLRLNYDYQYQFTMLQEELKVLSKMQLNHSSEFKTRSKFFTKDVVLALLNDCVYKIGQQIGAPAFTYRCNALPEAISIIEKIRYVSDTDYIRLSFLYSDFMRTSVYNWLEKNTKKCSAWKDVYKGAGAYYSLQNMILYHDCVIPGYYDVSKNESYEALNSILDMEFKTNTVWRLHSLLLDTIKYNAFNLKESIRKHNK